MKLGLTSDEWAGPMVIGSGTSLSVHEVVAGGPRRSAGAELPVRHGEAKAGEMPAVIVDPGQGPRGRLDARATPQLADGLVAVWEEWRDADVEAPVVTTADPSSVVSPEEYARLAPEERCRRRGLPGRAPPAAGRAAGHRRSRPTTRSRRSPR